MFGTPGESQPRVRLTESWYYSPIAKNPATVSALFSPTTFRSLTIRSRLVVSPMCQYSTKGGFASDYHLVHLGRFAMGGFGAVMVEATAIVPEGHKGPLQSGEMGNRAQALFRKWDRARRGSR
jgi:2,4-dienoyl-CoA reductase-like NADH-dependent reductase (Old Yellow Enzyme family)